MLGDINDDGRTAAKDNGHSRWRSTGKNTFPKLKKKPREKGNGKSHLASG
jgi:hypothetical protein